MVILRESVLITAESSSEHILPYGCENQRPGEANLKTREAANESGKAVLESMESDLESRQTNLDTVGTDLEIRKERSVWCNDCLHHAVK